MHMSKRRLFVTLVIIGTIVLTITTAGCIGSFTAYPDEVMVHKNVISVDSRYVDGNIITGLLFSPNNYKSSYFEAIDNYLPFTNPVLEIGAGFGPVTAYVNDKIKVIPHHLAVEKDTNLVNLLSKTKMMNNMGTQILNAVVSYSLPDNVVYYNLSKQTIEATGVSTPKENTHVALEVYTISELIEKYDFLKESKNISLLIDDDDVAASLFNKETRLAESVETIILNIQDSSMDKTLIRNASSLGFNLQNYPISDNEGYTVLAFKRTTKVPIVASTSDSETKSEQLTANK